MKLQKSFITKYENKDPPFKNTLGEIVYYRTYSRIKANGHNEQWWETIERVVNGFIFLAVKNNIHFERLGLSLMDVAMDIYDNFFNCKCLPGGRSLWIQGTDAIYKKKLYASLFNCCAISTKNDDKTLPFCFIMDHLMLGCGTGYDLECDAYINKPLSTTELHIITDSREGWVKSVKVLLDSYFKKDQNTIVFDYSLLRKKGILLRTFGGYSSGSAPLQILHKEIVSFLDKDINQQIRKRTTIDILNCIAKAIISGNIRRSAQIAIDDTSNPDFLDYKDYKKNPERMSHSWASNNSLSCNLGMDYTDIAKRICDNGEPGMVYFNNCRSFGRMNGIIDTKDNKDKLCFNPCAEIVLHSKQGEFCNIAEVFLNNCKNDDDINQAITSCYLYTKIIALNGIGDTYKGANETMLKNLRLGIGLSSISTYVEKNSKDELKKMCSQQYEYLQTLDKVFSTTQNINESIRLTCVKPSGTCSILANNYAPGIHYPYFRYGIRRIRMAKDHKLIPYLGSANYHIEEDIYDKNSYVVSFPLDTKCDKNVQNITIEEQFELNQIVSEFWADNAVSNTITFDREKEGDKIKNLLEMYENKIKNISLLPRDKGSYQQMPYEECTKTKYEEMLSRLKPLLISDLKDNHIEEPPKYCDSVNCENPKQSSYVLKDDYIICGSESDSLEFSDSDKEYAKNYDDLTSNHKF